MVRGDHWTRADIITVPRGSRVVRPLGALGMRPENRRRTSRTVFLGGLTYKHYPISVPPLATIGVYRRTA